jgi:hypothetical protein
VSALDAAALVVVVVDVDDDVDDDVSPECWRL